MRTARAILEAAHENQIPVDYYAGISALCVVILFAKFSTHVARGKKPPAIDCAAVKRWRHWRNVHVGCVILAWLAIVASLAVLGWAGVPESIENWVRPIVAILAGLASIGLAYDMVKEN